MVLDTIGRRLEIECYQGSVSMKFKSSMNEAVLLGKFSSSITATYGEGSCSKCFGSTLCPDTCSESDCKFQAATHILAYVAATRPGFSPVAEVTRLHVKILVSDGALVDAQWRSRSAVILSASKNTADLAQHGPRPLGDVRRNSSRRNPIGFIVDSFQRTVTSSRISAKRQPQQKPFPVILASFTPVTSTSPFSMVAYSATRPSYKT